MDDKKEQEDETKKLAIVVVCMSVFVMVLFGLGPSIWLLATDTQGDVSPEWKSNGDFL